MWIADSDVGILHLRCRVRAPSLVEIVFRGDGKTLMLRSLTSPSCITSLSSDVMRRRVGDGVMKEQMACLASHSTEYHTGNWHAAPVLIVKNN